MGDAGFFKVMYLPLFTSDTGADCAIQQGTSADQDSRFSNKEKKLLKSMSFPPEFDQKVRQRERCMLCIIHLMSHNAI